MISLCNKKAAAGIAFCFLLLFCCKVMADPVPEPASNSIHLNLGQTCVIPVQGLKRYLFTEPGKIKVVSSSISDIQLEASDIGFTFLHVWDVQGRKTYKFAVTRQELEEDKDAKKKSMKIAPFTAAYTMGYNDIKFGEEWLNGKSFATYRWDELRISGGSPYGPIESRIRYEDRQTGLLDASALTFMNTSLKSEKYSLAFGDINADINELVFLNLDYQGLYYQYYGLNDTITLIGGAEGNKFYGEQIYPYPLPSPNFYAVNIDHALSKTRTVSASIAVSQQDKPDRVLNFGSDDYAAYNATLQYTEKRGAHTYGALGGVADEIVAYNIFHRLRFNKFSLQSTWRDYQADYRSVTNTVPYQGERGAYFDASYDIYRWLSLGGYLNYYQDRRYPNPDDTQRFNNQEGLTAITALPLEVLLRLTSYRDDHRGSFSNAVTDGRTAELSRTCTMLGRQIKLTADYNNSQTKNFGDGLRYRDDIFSFSATAGLTDRIYMSAHKALGVIKFDGESDRETESQSLGVTFSEPFFQNDRFSHSISIEFSDSNSGFNDQSEVYGIFDITYKPLDDLRIDSSCKVSRVSGDRGEEYETQVYIKTTYLMETNLRWLPKGDILAVVYKDLNGNGVRDIGEPAVEGCSVAVLNPESAQKDQEPAVLKSMQSTEKGVCEFTDLKAEKIQVKLDTTTVPEGYRLTNENPQEVLIRQGSSKTVVFGLYAPIEVSCKVIVDLDADRKYGPQDKGDRIGRVSIDGKAGYIPDNNGLISIVKISEGVHTFEIDRASLPPDYSVIGERSFSLDLKGGDKKEIVFLLHANRTITGRVYKDINGNEIFDGGDTGIAGVVITAGSKRIKTDQNGYYMVRGLPFAEIDLAVDTSAIPAGFRPSRSDKTSRRTSEKPCVIKDVDFPFCEERLWNEKKEEFRKKLKSFIEADQAKDEPEETGSPRTKLIDRLGKRAKLYTLSSDQTKV